MNPYRTTKQSNRAFNKQLMPSNSSKMNLNGLDTVIGGVTGLATGIMNSVQGDYNTDIAPTVNASSTDELASFANTWNPVNYKREKPGAAFAQGLFGGAASGTSAGSIGGPMGAMIGAGAGGLAQGFSGLFGAKKRNRQKAAKENAINTSVANQIGSNNESISLNQTMSGLTNYAAMGGQFDVNSFNNGGTHEENPNEGILQGIGSNGLPNLVEEGEVKYKGFENPIIFSNRLNTGKMNKFYNLSNGVNNKSFAKAANYISKEAKERPNDFISNNTLQSNMKNLFSMQENLKDLNAVDESVDSFSTGGKIHIKPSKKGTFTAAATKHGMGVQSFANKVLANKDSYSSTMVKKANFAHNAANWHANGGVIMGRNTKNRFNIYPNGQVRTFENGGHLNTYKGYPSQGANVMAPGGMQNFANKAFSPINMENLAMLTPAISNAGLLMNSIASKPASYNYSPLDLSGYKADDTLPYKPISPWTMTNTARGQAGATRRALTNTSLGNRGAAQASLLAADANAQNAVGNIYLQADEYNRNRLLQSKEFANRAKQNNAQLASTTGMFNRQQEMQTRQLNDMAQAARRTAINEGINSMSSIIAGLGKNKFDWRTIRAMSPYGNPEYNYNR